MVNYKRPLIGPVQLNCVNFGVDTLLVNFKFAGPDGKPCGDTLPEEQAVLLDTWQQGARKEHKPVPTPLEYRGKTLSIRPHGSGVWSWLLFNEDVILSLSYGSMNGGVFCQARFLSHLLWGIGPELALVDLQALLYDFTLKLSYAQASEIHVCADVQGWYDFYDGSLNWQEGFVSRVVKVRARPDEVPTEREQEGGMSPRDIEKLEEELTRMPMITTSHRRLATLDFGSHGSEIMGQIYNKSAEIKKSKKTFFEPIWRANGWDGCSWVTRVEFRLRRKALSSFDLNDAYEVLTRLPAIWDYVTQEWLRFVDLSSSQDTNKSRLPTDLIWSFLQTVYPHEHADLQDEQGEQECRLDELLYSKPVEVIEHVTAQTAYAEWDDPLAQPEKEHWIACDVLALREQLQQEPIEVVRDLAREAVEQLSPYQVTNLIKQHSRQPFQEVQATLIKRARRLARKKNCISSLSGYLTSLVALTPDDEFASAPTLSASLMVAFDEVKKYNDAKGRVYLEEVWKKRLAYGFITAHQLEEERRLHGVELTKEDWEAWSLALDSFTKRNDVYLNRHGKNKDIA